MGQQQELESTALASSQVNLEKPTSDADGSVQPDKGKADGKEDGSGNAYWVILPPLGAERHC